MSLGKTLMLSKWAKITIIEWQLAIGKMRIGKSHELFNSFEDHIIASAGGDIEKIKFIYLYYGAMVDMGVGNGTPLGDVRENTTSRRLEGRQLGNRRKAKKWNGKVLYRETSKLADLCRQYYGSLGITTVNENLPAEIKLPL